MSGKTVPVVAVLNMKGGVGKTTASAHVTRALFSQFKAATTIIDFDPQFNLTQALFKRPAYDILKGAGKTIMAAMEPLPSSGLLEVRTTSAPPPAVDDISHTLWFYRQQPEIRLAVVPGDFSLSKYTLVDHGRKLKDVEGRFLNFICNAKKVNEYICIDCNPSSSFLTLCVLKAATHILVPVRADRYSVLGLELLYEFVESIPGLPHKPKFMVLLNDVVRNAAPTSVEVDLRAHSVFGSMTLGNRLYKSKLLSAQPDYTGFASDKRGPYSSQVRSELGALAKEIGAKVGLKEGSH
ncbi:ParA family protein [Lysobacter capsici]|uniref:ParA family protein n=1 Tax=Lysobacter capsici TaxID=435897 RepID=UPI00287BB24F|nr:ParA family protein [Lysobacter capsici]WND78529.1 ParA family protein [Lysobacter capsici]WND83724.1 ParA family protein [Lysobacter capsici]